MRRLTDDIIKTAIENAIAENIVEKKDETLMGYYVKEDGRDIEFIPTSSPNRFILEIVLNSNRTMICHKEAINTEDIKSTLELFNLKLSRFF